MQKQSNAPKKTATSKVVAMKKPTYEELEKTVKELQGKSGNLPTDLDGQIEYFKNKRLHIQNRDRLLAIKLMLNTAIERVTDEKNEADPFNTELYQLELCHREYNRKGNTIFTVQSTAMIQEYLNVLIEAVETKIVETEKLIRS